MISKKLLVAAAAAFLVSAPIAAHATVVYNNEGGNPLAGDCSFNTTCAANAGRGNEFAAQAFSLSSAATIDGGSFTQLDVGSPSSVNWAFYLSGGATPTGPALFSGNSAAVTTFLAPNSIYNQDLISFSLPTLTLGAGNYFFAVQEVTSTAASYLQQGVVTSGAAETHDGGATWSPGYETAHGGDSLGGVAVALTGPGGVPEPASWALMLMGFGGLGAVLRHRRGQAVAA